MRINKVEYLKDYKLELLFSDKSLKIVNLENMIMSSRGIFSPLKDKEFFRKVELDECELSICWPNGADICPDLLYSMGKDILKTGSKKSSKTSSKKGK